MALLSQLLVGGFAVGWLMGLSASPVVSAVISAVLSALLLYVTVDRATAPLPPRLAVALVVGVAIGGSLGLWTRTHNWLGESTDDIVARWHGKTDLDDKALYRRLLEHEYAVAGEKPSPPIREGVLFSAVSKSECDRLRPLDGVPLRNTLATVTDKHIVALSERLPLETLPVLVKTLCDQSLGPPSP